MVSLWRFNLIKREEVKTAGLTQYRASSADEVMVLLQQGNQNRTTKPTSANETSSLFHAIVQAVVEFRVRECNYSKTSL